MKFTGIDFGTSYTNIVELEENLKKTSFSNRQPAKNFFGKKGRKIGFTGCIRKKRFLKILSRNDAIEFGELECIAEGAKFLSGKKEFLVVNVGTGTPFVFVRNGKTIHLGGSGIGGGTLAGLAELLLKEKVENLEKLARKGKKTLDYTVCEVLGKKIGIVPSDATASNFGKTPFSKKIGKNDVAFSLLSMVSETIGVMASLAASAVKTKTVVFTGKTVQNEFIRKKISETCAIFGKKSVFPADGEYATAIGAAILAKDSFKSKGKIIRSR